MKIWANQFIINRAAGGGVSCLLLHLAEGILPVSGAKKKKQKRKRRRITTRHGRRVLYVYIERSGAKNGKKKKSHSNAVTYSHKKPLRVDIEVNLVNRDNNLVTPLALGRCLPAAI